MPRDIPVGNGSVLVAFDRDYQVRDVYYPHVGKENQAGCEPCRFGVWADGQFSWMGSEWQKILTYRENTLVTSVTARNDRLGIELCCSDCVDYEEPVFIRQIRVKDLRGTSRDVRLFFHYDFNLYGNNQRDTVHFDPKTRAIIHYKDKRYCLVNVATHDRFGVEFYATGEKGAAGKEGTWKDAEDGWLAGNPAAHGSVDSTVAINLRLGPNGEQTCYQWVAFGTDYNEVKAYNTFVWETAPAELIRRTHNYWLLWATKEELNLAALPEDLRRVFVRNLLILRTQIDADGGVIAGSDSDANAWAHGPYSYVWPRVGALAALGLDAAGYPELSRGFYIFCAASQSEDGWLLPKYYPDGALADMVYPWVQNGNSVLPIEEDSTALVVHALWLHFERYRDLDFVEPLYRALVRQAGDFMAGYVDHETGLPRESYDFWHDRYGVHTYTACAVIAGLWSAAKFARVFGDDELARKYNTAADRMKDALPKFLYHNDLHRFARCGYRREQGYELDMTLDASLIGLFAGGTFPADDPRVVSTMDQLWDALWVKTDVGGVARFQGDTYFRVNDKLPGNPWTVSTLGLAHWLIARARSTDELDRAIPVLQWVARYALPSGVLPEQINPCTCEPISVSPATLSHGRFLHVMMLYLEALETLQPGTTHRRDVKQPMNVYTLPTVRQTEARHPAERVLAEVT